MKKTDKKQSKSRQEALNELTAGLEQSIKDFMDGDKYRAFLSKMSHLHNYSLNNQILIARQRPDATLYLLEVSEPSGQKGRIRNPNHLPLINQIPILKRRKR